MDVTLAPVVIGIVVAGMFVGGLASGLTGFGFALVGTALLATVFDPATAVVFMLIPLFAANVSLVRELDWNGIRSCVRRFWPFVAAAVAGVLVGMSLLTSIPTGPLTLALGLFTLAYVALSQDRIPVPGVHWLTRRCFTDHALAKVGIGLFSGLVFGASNVGVQVVAYLDSLSLDRSVFVGVIAMIFLGIGAVRIGAAAVFGLYGEQGTLLLSAVATVPAILGVTAGRRLRAVIPDRYQTLGVFLLLAIIGIRLTVNGLRSF